MITSFIRPYRHHAGARLRCWSPLSVFGWAIEVDGTLRPEPVDLAQWRRARRYQTPITGEGPRRRRSEARIEPSQGGIGTAPLRNRRGRPKCPDGTATPEVLAELRAAGHCECCGEFVEHHALA